MSDPRLAPPGENPLLALREVTLAFGTKVIQRDLFFDVQRGSIFAVMGGSGCGKSTVLKSMIGLLRPRVGKFVIDGEDYWTASAERRTEIGRRRFGVLFQNSALWSAMTIGMNVALPMQMFTRLDEITIRRLVMLKLGLVGMEHAAELFPSELSGGMRKRAGLARALALDPDILFFDEPSAGLDPITSSRLDDLILNLRDGLGATIVMVSHELPSLFAIADDGVFLDAHTKTVIAHGSPSVLRDTCTDPQVQAFMQREHPDLRRCQRRVNTMSADRQTAIGAFVFGGFTLALAAIILFGNFRLFNPTTRAAIVFQGSISGLSVGAPVTFRGVRVGAVESIVLQFDAQTRNAYIPVTIQLEPERVRVTGDESKTRKTLEIPDLVALGLRAELITQSFVTGQSQIDLNFDPSSPAALHPNVTSLPEIPTRLSTIQRVQEQLSELPLAELVANANGALQSLRDLSDKLDKELPPLVANLRTASDGSSRAVEVATNAIADLQSRLDNTLTRITQLVATSDQQVSQRGADLHTLLASSTQTVLQARETLNDLRSLTSSRGETRANIDSTVRDLAAAAASLRGFANDVEHNPQLLLTGRRP